MTDSIYTLEKNVFPYDDLSLANPHGLQGGAYFSKLKLLGKTISFQTPKSKTKNGIIKTDKKIYCDLLFHKENEEVIEFISELEDKIKNLIYEKKDKWFHTDMDMDTIDYHWQNVLRPYKGSYVLLRCFIKKPKNTLNSTPSIQIYNEDEQLLELDKVTKDNSIVSLLDLTGLKFTSQSFSLEFNVTQIMILNDEIKRNKCLIKKNTSQQSKHLEKNSENPDHLTNSENSENSETFSNSISPENVKEPVENDNIELTNDVQNDNSITEEIKVDISKDSKPLDVAEEKDTQNVINESTIKVENNNVKLSVSDNLEKNVEETDKNDNEVDGLEELNEINLEIPTELEPVHLKNPNEVYLEIYREVKKRAKEAKKKAIEAYLEAKRIKSLYLLDEIESSDDEGELLAITDDV
jgi:phosphoribosyl-ATP pyrophosphohydrolase